MKAIISMFTALFMMSAFTMKAHEGDSPATLAWVQKNATILEDRLTTAINVGDEAILLVVLMESAADFEAVALAGLYCYEARVAAELGRNASNWVTGFTQDKDLNALILRAQEARKQAVRMRAAAEICTQEAIETPPDESFSPADILRANAQFVIYDLNDGLASQNFHILAQKIEHAERGLRDTKQMARQLNNCDTLVNAAQTALDACTAALSAKNWTMVNDELKKALEMALVIKASADACQ